jgi:hypothetical protein
MGNWQFISLKKQNQNGLIIVLLLFLISNKCFAQTLCQDKFEINSNGFLITKIVLSTNDKVIEIPACIDNNVNIPIANYAKFKQQNIVNEGLQLIKIPKPTIMGGFSFVNTLFQNSMISSCGKNYSYDAIMFGDTQLFVGVYPAQVIFGMDLFLDQVIKFDFNKNEMTIDDNSNIIDSNLFYEVPSKFQSKKQSQTIFIKVRINNKELFTKIDIGYNGFLIGNNSTFKKINLPLNNYEQENAQIVYLGGNDIKNNKIVKNVSVNIGAKQVMGNYYVANKLKTELNIGLTFFKQFEMLIIDGINEKVYIKR